MVLNEVTTTIQEELIVSTATTHIQEPDCTKNEYTSITDDDRAIKTTQEGEHSGLKNEVTITNQEEFTMSTIIAHIHEPNCTENEHTSITHEDRAIKTTHEGEHDGLKNEMTIISSQDLTMSTTIAHIQ